MKQGVKWPWIPFDEYNHRVDRAKEMLSKHSVDAVLLFSPASLRYYAGWTDVAQMHGDDWRGAVIVCQDRDPIAIVHSIYGSHSIPLTSFIEDVRCWSEEVSFGLPTDFWSLFFNTLKEIGLDKKTLGLETGPCINTYLSFDEYKILTDGLPKANIVSADNAIFEQRMIKTPWEIETIREGCRRACLAIRDALETIKPGVNELDIHKAFWHGCVEYGLLESPNESTWLLFTTNANEVGGIHRWITPPVDRIVEVGDQGMFDIGPTYQGYRMDFQRAFYVGQPPEKQLRFHDIAKEALLETIASIKPGIPMSEIFKASVDAVEKRDPTQIPILDFAGHGMGLYSHEPPWIRANEGTLAQPGMVLCVELTTFDPDQEVVGGYPEDIVLVTDDGTENLTRHLSHDLWVAS